MKKCRRVLSTLMAMAVLLTSVNFSNFSFADSTILSPQIFYHLDMGVQLAYSSGCDWGSKVYGTDSITANPTLSFGSNIEVQRVYPYEGSDYNIDDGTDNLSGSGSGQANYDAYYKEYVSTNMSVTSFSGSGNSVSFQYTAKLNSSAPLDVVDYGALGLDNQVYQLFGGKSKVESQQPAIASAIETALTAGRNGTAGSNRLYLVFTPNVIEYRKYVTVGDLAADLDLPTSAKQGESFTVADASLVDSNVTVDRATLECQVGSGSWATVATWPGLGTAGKNTEGKLTESFPDIGTVSYRLTIYDINGISDTVIKSINITDSRTIEATASLSLPAYTYEGHTALAEDYSTFVVDGVDYSATRAYEEGIATNSFKGNSGTISFRRLTDTKSEGTFNAAGNYNVTLTVKPTSGNNATDTKSITVRPTPYIEDSLGGFQKQNRKQILTIAVATMPGKPLTDYSVMLTDKKTGQSVTLTKDEPQQNNATIKTRVMTAQPDAKGEFTYITLEFLTKTPVYNALNPDYTQDFSYSIYVKDSKGDTAATLKNFTVAPDNPPNAGIVIQDTFIRNKGTNVAEIQVEDGSTTDGDQLQRLWTVQGVNVESLPGFADGSFGSRQKIQYNKTGVGPETIKLDVQDVWNEPTLEEYVTAADHLSASVTATTEVVNIAPTVRLEPIDAEEANVVILTNKASESSIRSGVNSMKAALLEAGIDADIEVIPTAIPNSNGYKASGSYTWPVALNDSTQNNSGFLYDSEFVYSVEASGMKTVSTYVENAIPPYTVKALRSPASGNGSLETVWSYTVNGSTNFKVKLDSLEKYVYIACSDTGKTILLNRKNGAYLTTLPFVVSDNIYTTDENNNLYFLESNKIQKYDSAAGTLKTVANCGGTNGQMKDGKIAFVSKAGSMEYAFTQFDMKTESISSYTPYQELNRYDYGGDTITDVSVRDVDSNGNAVFVQTFSNQGDIEAYNIWVTDKEKGTVKPMRITGTDLRCEDAGFVKDETGNAVYLYTLYATAGSSKYYHYLTLYDLSSDTLQSVFSNTFTKTSGISSGQIVYARLHTQENKIYIMQNTDFGMGVSSWSIRCRISLPNFAVDEGYTGWGWDVADENAGFNNFMMLTFMKHDNYIGTTNRVKTFQYSVSADQAEQSALSQFASFTEDATILMEKGFTSALDLIGKIKAAVKVKTAVMLSSSDSSAIGLSKTVNLKAGETYYYEYDIKAPGATDAEVNGAAPQVGFDVKNQYAGTENQGSYYVTDVIEENFNGTLNPFFTLDSGRITDCLQTSTTGSYSKSQNLSSESQISFTIPAGKTAVVMMDVSGNVNPVSGWKSGAYIDGVRYEKLPKSGFGVTGYLHPYILAPGKHTIKALVCETTDQIKITDYMKVDNIKVFYLSDTKPTDAVKYSQMEIDDGWTRASGSFKAPEKISEFKSQGLTRLATWPDGILTSGSNTTTTYYEFTLPAGKSGRVFATIQGKVTSGSYTAGTYTFPGYAVDHYGSLPSTYLYVSSGERLFAGDFSGYVCITSKATNQYRCTASISSLETYVMPDNLKGKTNLFYSNTLDKVYSQADSFSGSANFEINLDPGSGNQPYLIKNVKIYYLDDAGRKVYAYNNALDNLSEMSKWALSANTSAELYGDAKPEEKDTPLVYKKGQLVAYNIFYDDYENDPSKAQSWRYTHTPYNDGPNSNAAFILDEDGNVVTSNGALVLSSPIDRFYIDGKYTVEHWQYDNTNRNNDALLDYTKYDKKSNVETITFYVEGGGAAPWVTSIKTVPGKVSEGAAYKLQIGVDDVEKDILRLTTEVYKDKRLVYTHKQTNIVADGNGEYPVIETGFAPQAAAGKYEVVCTVRDWAGTGIGSYKFTVISDGKIEGSVTHTAAWNTNRKGYTLNITDGNSEESPRTATVFWAGEKLLLSAKVGGAPTAVTAQILGTAYKTNLTNTGSKNSDGEWIYSGSIWDSSMIDKWGRNSSEALTIRFTAEYSGSTKTHDVMITMNSKPSYWDVHQYY